MDSKTEAIVKSIHSAPTKAVLYVTGGAVATLTWLMSVPGANGTVLEAVVPYAVKASDQLVGNQPSDSYSGRYQSIQLAEAAYRRAAELTDVGEWNFVGVAAACALRTELPKKGDHRCSVSVRTHKGIKTYAATFEKLVRGRAEEDIVASQMVLISMAEACRAYSPEEAMNSIKSLLKGREKHSIQVQLVEFANPVASLLSGTFRCIEFSGHDYVLDAPRNDALVLPGSFNPLHEGHLQMMQAAEKQTGQKGLFELAVVNPDKGTLDEDTVHKRIQQFCDQGIPLLLTRASLFRDKAALMSNCTFLVGYDTAVRIIQPKYYGNSETNMMTELGFMRNRGCRFLVAGRAVAVGGSKAFLSLRDAQIPTSLKDMFVGLDGFRLDISSTEIRSRQKNDS